MAPIYACSVAALAVFVRKLSELRRARLGELDWIEPVLADLAAHKLDAARDRLAASTHPAARAMSAAVSVMPRRPDRARAEANRVGSQELQRFETHLGLLSFIAQVAPLLGLLGTVIGMVGLFLDMEHAPAAAADMGRLSSGIWTALLTTAAGLVVAVPTLAGYSYLSARMDGLRLLLHDAIERTLTAAPPPLATDVGQQSQNRGKSAPALDARTSATTGPGMGGAREP